MAIYPTPEQIRALLAGPDDQPVVMVNLLRFKPQADGGRAMSGQDAYRAVRDARCARSSSRRAAASSGPATSTPW